MVEMVGEKGDEPVARVLLEFVQAMVDGRFPKYLRRWYGGGMLIGIGKDGKPLDEDARPIVVG